MKFEFAYIFFNLTGFVHSSFLMITPMFSVHRMAIKILYTIKHDKYTVMNLSSFLKGKLRRVHFFVIRIQGIVGAALFFGLVVMIRLQPCKQYTGWNIWIALLLLCQYGVLLVLRYDHYLLSILSRLEHNGWALCNLVKLYVTCSGCEMKACGNVSVSNLLM